MPEASALYVIREFLGRCLVGQSAVGARVLKPTALRSLVTEDFAADLEGEKAPINPSKGQISPV